MSHSNKYIKRLTKYIRDDRLDRVKSLIRKHGVVECSNYRNKKKQSWLHLACKYGSKYVVQYFTRIGFDASCRDRKGNLPLHIAARYVLSLETNDPSIWYMDFIEPLMKVYPQGRKVANKYGIRPKDWLKLWRKRHKESVPLDHNHKESEDHSHRRNNEDVSWWEKLSYEMFSECHESQFDDDYGTHNETYDEWASRMSSEHDAKRCRNSNSHSKPHRKQYDAKSQARFEESIRQNEANRLRRVEEAQTADLLRQKRRYEMLCVKLFHAKCDSEVNADNLPWQLNVTNDQVVKVLLAGIDPTDVTAKKKYLREQQIRWHPDKFQQLWSSRVAKDDHDEVLAIVNHLSQIINGILENM